MAVIETFSPQPEPFKICMMFAGDPQGKGRPRAVSQGGFARLYADKKTQSYEGMVRYAAQQEMAGRSPFAGPVCLQLTAIFQIPKSMTKRDRPDALAGRLVPAKKPDLDNIIKAVTDACNAVVYTDDALIVRVVAEKVYGATPGVLVVIRQHFMAE